MGDTGFDSNMVRRVLADKGLLDVDGQVLVRRLSGGVSGTVVLAETEHGRFVLKRPLTRFETRDTWTVPRARIRVEAEAARFLADRLDDDAVAVPLGYHAQSQTLVLAAAPVTYGPWKARLLAGSVDGSLTRCAGTLLGRLHAAGLGLDDGAFRHDDLFDAQRIDPYFRRSAERHPALAEPLLALEGRFHARDDLVHGDFSPKNLLTDGDRFMLIDHEVVTRGDAAFDVGFFLTHLVLKAIRRPRDAARYRSAAGAFLEGHAAAAGTNVGDVAAVRTRAVPFLGGCLVARVAGKSPVDYLDAEEQVRAVSLGQRLLEGGFTRVDHFLADLPRHVTPARDPS